MISPDTKDRKTKILLFSLLLLGTAAVAAFLMNFLWRSGEPENFATTTNMQPAVVAHDQHLFVMPGSELLSRRLHSLQEADQLYAKLLTETNDQKQLDSLSQQIFLQEENFRASLDSIYLNTPALADSGLQRLTESVMGSYRTLLEGRQAIGSLRNALAQTGRTLGPDEMVVLQLENDVQEKDRRIAMLESEAKLLTAGKNGTLKPAPTGTEIAHVEALTKSIYEQETRVAELTAANNNLKKENERLETLQRETATSATPLEQSLKTKTAGLQMKIDELNAELRLAQVDCNLSRVDAGKIISNSRQRKELLSEASGILTSLASSGDAGIRKKVQDKILRLNQVAANSRD